MSWDNMRKLNSHLKGMMYDDYIEVDRFNKNKEFIRYERKKRKIVEISIVPSDGNMKKVEVFKETVSKILKAGGDAEGIRGDLIKGFEPNIYMPINDSPTTLASFKQRAVEKSKIGGFRVV